MNILGTLLVIGVVFSGCSTTTNLRLRSDTGPERRYSSIDGVIATAGTEQYVFVEGEWHTIWSGWFVDHEFGFVSLLLHWKAGESSPVVFGPTAANGDGFLILSGSHVYQAGHVTSGNVVTSEEAGEVKIAGELEVQMAPPGAVLDTGSPITEPKETIVFEGILLRHASALPREAFMGGKVTLAPQLLAWKQRLEGTAPAGGN